MFREICKDFEYQVKMSGFDSVDNGESDDFCRHWSDTEFCIRKIDLTGFIRKKSQGLNDCNCNGNKKG